LTKLKRIKWYHFCPTLSCTWCKL